jgi:DNA repair protein RadC
MGVDPSGGRPARPRSYSGRNTQPSTREYCLMRRALEVGAASLVLVHNHPSGDPSPSGADLEMTAQIQAAATVVSVTIADHVIVGNGRWLSFREQGLL